MEKSKVCERCGKEIQNGEAHYAGSPATHAYNCTEVSVEKLDKEEIEDWKRWMKL